MKFKVKLKSFLTLSLRFLLGKTFVLLMIWGFVQAFLIIHFFDMSSTSSRLIEQSSSLSNQKDSNLVPQKINQDRSKTSAAKNKVQSLPKNRAQAKLQQELLKRRQKQAKLQQEVQALLRRRNKMQDQLNRLQRALGSSRTAETINQARVNDLQRLLAQNQQRLQVVLKSLKMNEDKYHALQSRLERLVRQLQARKIDVKTLQKRLENDFHTKEGQSMLNLLRLFVDTKDGHATFDHNKFNRELLLWDEVSSKMKAAKKKLEEKLQREFSDQRFLLASFRKLPNSDNNPIYRFEYYSEGKTKVYKPAEVGNKYLDKKWAGVMWGGWDPSWGSWPWNNWKRVKWISNSERRNEHITYSRVLRVPNNLKAKQVVKITLGEAYRSTTKNSVGLPLKVGQVVAIDFFTDPTTKKIKALVAKITAANAKTGEVKITVFSYEYNSQYQSWKLK